MLNYKQMIQVEAKRLGFAYCGFSKADFLEDEAPRLEKWLQQNKHGEMYFMQENFDKRLDPRLLVDGAKTVISLMLNYYTDKEQEASAPKISKYAYGKDKTPKIAVTKNAHIVKGSLVIDIPLVLRLIIVTM